MSIITRLLHRDEHPSAATTEVKAECAHAVLLPHWDKLEDMGHEELASGFRCDACGADFAPDRAQLMREQEAARLRDLAEKTTEEASQT